MPGQKTGRHRGHDATRTVGAERVEMYCDTCGEGWSRRRCAHMLPGGRCRLAAQRGDTFCGGCRDANSYAAATAATRVAS